MKLLDRMIKLAAKIEKRAQEISQSGTTELFFGSESKQREFAAAVQSQSGSFFKILSAYYAKSQQPCSMNISVSANPGKGATFDIVTNPPALATSLRSAVDNVFKSTVGSSIGDKLKAANAGVAKGSGSGKLEIASLVLE